MGAPLYDDYIGLVALAVLLSCSVRLEDQRAIKINLASIQLRVNNTQKQMYREMSTEVEYTERIMELFALNDAHKTWDIRDKAQRNRLPRIRLHVFALCGTCRVGNLNVIIATLGLPSGILPLLIDKGRDVSICLLSTFEQFIARKAQQNLRIDCIYAHERPAVGEPLGGLL